MLDLSQKLETLDIKLRDLQKRAAAIDAVIAERRTRAGVLSKNIAEAKHRLDLNPDVQGFMLALQQRVHQRGVGLYEKLLTALVQDVLPENPHPVCLELSTDKGLPALTIQLGRDDMAQNIFDDTGGSLTNVVSSGLRFIALARSPLRKFLVLDEPDCWIEPFRIPRFADILSDMSEEVGVQAILISHHPDASFASLPDRMRLEKDAAGCICVKRMRKPVWTDDAQPGIRSIRLERFMSHKDTLLELGPGVNVLSGPNHIGKSAIVNSLRVFAYHEGADRQIMHGFNDFVITITLENGKVMTCKRNRKGGRKTIYTYFEPGMDKPREEPAGKTEIPEFVGEHLNIERLNDLDIQLSHQKMPVFLLNEPKTKQASLLSAGMEADHVRKMLEIYKKWNDQDKACVRTEERELLNLTQSLGKWDTVFSGKSLGDTSLNIDLYKKNLSADINIYKNISDIIARLERFERLKDITTVFMPPDAPAISPVEQMFKLCNTWARLEELKKISVPSFQNEVPVLKGIDRMVTFGKSWQGIENKYTQLKSINIPEHEITAPDAGISQKCLILSSAWSEAEDDLEKKTKDLVESVNEYNTVQDELKTMGQGTCVLCNQPWPHEHGV